MADEGSRSNIINDFRLAMKRKGWRGVFWSLLLHPGNQAIALYRIYRWLYLHGFERLAALGMRLNYFFCGVEINYEAEIGPDFHLDHPIGVLIHRRCRIGKGVRLYSHCMVGAHGEPGNDNFVDIRDYAQIYHGAIVGADVTVGEFAEVGLHSVARTHDIPPYAVAIGAPARVVKVKGKPVDPGDFKDYKYDSSDYEGPPVSIDHLEQ
ncbi:MAG: hypothetical protein JXA49_04975 [Actinobacteria bacterium]|nr:hypothetical protein [Actinomycetota bacterium]